ncbi:MAG: hypothetical protein IJZ64_07890 [Ruminococcus sp.]|nr:hypothetical protein [Ruminococcus sp.]
MNNFTIIYKILKALESSMDLDEFDIETISAEHLKISENRRNRILIQLHQDGYIENVYIRKFVDDTLPSVQILPNTTITIKGLEYLEENSLMSKAKNVIKEAKEFIPGL